MPDRFIWLFVASIFFPSLFRLLIAAAAIGSFSFPYTVNNNVYILVIIADDRREKYHSEAIID